MLQTYTDALGRSDYGTVKSLFTHSGQVKSPFLGEMPAGPFFHRLAGASAENAITPIDLFLSNSGKNHATAYFQYDWTVRDGTLITFKVMDLFTFEPYSDKITYLDIIYDTHQSERRQGTSTSFSWGRSWARDGGLRSGRPSRPVAPDSGPGTPSQSAGHTQLAVQAGDRAG